MTLIVVALFVAAVLLFSSMKIVDVEQRAVVERLGRPLQGAKGPGLVFHAPFIDRLRLVSIARQDLPVPQVDVISNDNTAMQVDLAVVYRVLDPVKALYAVSDFRHAIAEMVGTAVRSAAKEVKPHDSTIERKALAGLVEEKIRRHLADWGIGLEKVDVTGVRSR
jgi:regulator of protease activity HflC (stomatin/prohibitin superfamily)